MTFCQMRKRYMHPIQLRAITVSKVATLTVASGRIATCCLLANNIEHRPSLGHAQVGLQCTISP